jgi:hypothetical protein
MHYKGKDYHAQVEQDQIVYCGKPMTPSELVDHIANGTARNAWKDLYIKFPDDEGWRLAQDLREAREVTVEELGL